MHTQPLPDQQVDLDLRCANCGLEINFAPVMAGGQAYCCGGCAEGGPCYCSYDPVEVERLPASRQKHHRLYTRIGRIQKLAAG